MINKFLDFFQPSQIQRRVSFNISLPSTLFEDREISKFREVSFLSKIGSMVNSRDLIILK